MGKIKGILEFSITSLHKSGHGTPVGFMVLKRMLSECLSFLPFEKDFYEKYDFDVDFVGHPLLDVISNFKADPDFLQ